MEIFQEQYIFTGCARKCLSPDLEETFSRLVKEWGLYHWEDGLLFQLYPVFADDVLVENDLVIADKLIKTLRGDDGSLPFTIEEMIGEDLPLNWLENEETMRRMYRTVYYCINKNEVGLAMEFRVGLDLLFTGNSLPLDQVNGDAITGIYIAVCAYFFRNLPAPLTHYLFASQFVVLMLKLGFDLEIIIRRAVNDIVLVESRNSYCLELAASLADNQTEIGKAVTGENRDIKYWIDNFRIFSKGNFSGSELLNFLADYNYLGGCNAEEKKIINILLQLYAHLVNGFLIVPDGDLEAVNRRMNEMEKKGIAGDYLASLFGSAGELEKKAEKEVLEIVEKVSAEKVLEKSEKIPTQTPGLFWSGATIRKFVESEIGYYPNAQYPEVEKVLARLQEMAKDYNDPAIADLYYFDEQTGEFKWRE